MKRALFTIVAFMLANLSIWAARAYNLPTDIAQADGATLTVIGHGDENFHFYTTTDGVLLCQVGNGFQVARISDNGEIIPSGLLAHNKANRSAAEQEAAASQNRTKFFAAMQHSALKMQAASRAASNVSFVSHNGNVKVLVIMAQFSDTKFTINEPFKAFDQYLNAEGEMTDYNNNDTKNYGSVARYFKDMSNGAFTPSFDLYGPVTLSNPLSTYGAGNDNMQLFVTDVCNAAKEQLGVKFADYDSDGDGYADLVYIIYAGYAESWSGNPTDCIWPKSGTLANTIEIDGTKISRFGVNNELNGRTGQQVGMINGIGLFCHEFSHCLGMPDFYATTAATQECQNAENQSMDYWSIMDMGEYVNNGYRPTAYTAWERSHFGWLDIDELKESANGIELKSIDEGGKAYCIKNPADESGNEFVVIENIQKTGWNQSVPGHGMIAYHVDYDPSIFTTSVNTVNNTLGHPRMAIIPADGLLMKTTNAKYADVDNVTALHMSQVKGDPFPGTSAVDRLTSDQNLPNYAWYAGSSKIGHAFTAISEDTESGTVTFNFTADPSTGIDGITLDRDNNSRTYTIDGICTGNGGSQPQKGIYIKNGHKYIAR